MWSIELFLDHCPMIHCSNISPPLSYCFTTPNLQNLIPCQSSDIETTKKNRILSSNFLICQENTDFKLLSVSGIIQLLTSPEPDKPSSSNLWDQRSSLSRHSTPPHSTSSVSARCVGHISVHSVHSTPTPSPSLPTYSSSSPWQWWQWYSHQEAQGLHYHSDWLRSRVQHRTFQ